MNIFNEIKMMGNYCHLRRARKALASRVINDVATLTPFLYIAYSVYYYLRSSCCLAGDTKLYYKYYG